MVSVREIKSVDEFNNFVNEKDGKIRVLKCSTPWCNPCKVLAETIKNLDRDKLENVLFAEANIDTDETEDIGAQLGIRNVPVLVFYKDGVELKRNVGLIQADGIYKIVEELK